MTASTEADSRSRAPDRPCGPIWRESTRRRQQAAIEPGATTLSCSAERGSGGLGRHVEEIAAAVERAGGPLRPISGGDRRTGAPSRASGSARASAGALARLAAPRVLRALGAARVPVSPGVRTRVFMAEFDTWAAARIGTGENLIAFNGQALEQLRGARRAGYAQRGLVSANSHVRRLRRQHARALADYPLERSWTERLGARNLAEYEEADRIYVSSRYVRDSFLEEGFDERRLVDFPLTPDPRFAPQQRERDATRFEIVYVGSLVVHKGVPLLIDAVRRLSHRDLSLTLVGGGRRAGCVASCRAPARRIPGSARNPAIRWRTCAEHGSACTPPTRTASPTHPLRRSPAACP